MIVLLPVTRYRVQYQVALGRPYSFFERLVLEAIDSGQASLDALESTFRIHRRVLIESIVTLMQAGWVAFDTRTHALVSTAAGTKAVERPGELPRNITVSERSDYLVGERVNGQLAKGGDITYVAKAELRKYFNDVATLPKSDLPHPVETGMMVPLLRRYEGEWIRWCGPVDIVRDGADYVVVDVDTSTGTITGIPAKWESLLREDLLERARGKERQLIQAGTPPTDSALSKLVRRSSALIDGAEEEDPNEWYLDDIEQRLIIGDNQHRLVLADCLENARSYVCIVSGRMSARRVQELSDALRAAIRRGVLVDIIWGTAGADDDHRQAIDLLKKIEWDSQHASEPGRLSVARMASQSHAKALLADMVDGFEAVVGSHDWLAGDGDDSRIDLSLAIRESGPVAQIARIVADLAAADERLATGAGVTRLQHAAAELDRQMAEAAERRDTARTSEGSRSEVPDRPPPDRPSGRVRVRLIVGREHHAVLSVLSREARQRLILVCHRWGADSQNAFRYLGEALERGCARVEMRYGMEAVRNGHDTLTAEFLKLGGVIQHAPRLHAKILACDDDTAALTSFDWLSPDLERAHVGAGEIGFLLRGERIASALLRHLRIPLVATPPPLAAQYIRSFSIAHVRSVNRLEWRLPTSDAAAGWHVIIGDNGSGKTSVLRALSLALMGRESAQALRQDWNAWVRGAETSAEVDVLIEPTPGLQEAPEGNEASKNVVLRWQRTGDGAILVETTDNADEIVSVGYGPFRRFTGDAENERQLAFVPRLARHISLFDERAALTETLVWLRDLRFRSLENDAEATLLLQRLTTLVNECRLLPSGLQLLPVRPDAILFQDVLGYDYPIEELSDGYRSILSLTFDIVRHLSVAHGAARVFDTEQANVVSAPGIVLIDEIDAHLHPSWQRSIGQWFRARFPRIQFIVTTHSPLICQAAEVGTVFRLPTTLDDSDRGEMVEGDARARLVYGNILEAYSSGAFGDYVNRSDSSREHIQRLAQLNQKELVVGLLPAEADEQARLRATLPTIAHTTTFEGNT